MKKLMFTAAVAAGLAAFGDGIESQNTVGYSTRSMPANTFRMLSSPWESTQGNLNINAIMPYQSNVTVDWVKIGDGDEEIETYFASAPQIQVQITSGAAEGNYYTYYYIKNAYVNIKEQEE